MTRALFAGFITGTSMDGIDAALVAVDDDGHPELLHGLTCPLEPELAALLHSLVRGEPVTLDSLCEADAWLGEAIASAATTLFSAAGVAPEDVTAIGSHGQTVHHRPTARHAGTLQIGDPNIIAERTGITTVADLRRRDMAAGGQGAPLLPALHQHLLAREDEARVVLNLGGIANVTLLGAGAREAQAGFDTGPANTLMDLWTRRHRGAPFDGGGRWAAEGSCNEALLARLLQEDYFSRSPPKSTGRELFNLDWLDAHLAGFAEAVAPVDVQATLLALSARTVAMAIERHAQGIARVIVAGGGVHNTSLMDALQANLSVPVEPAANHGVDADHLEAMAFAWLAWARLEGRAVAPASVTGARGPAVLGGVYAGRGIVVGR